MTNLSTAFKIKTIMMIGVVLGFITIGFSTFGDEVLLAILATLTTICIISSFLYFKHMLNLIDKAIAVTNRAADGDLNARIMDVSPFGPMGQLHDGINQLLDVTESFAREAGAALEFASRGEYYRKILPRGMVGDFSMHSSIVNNGLDAMERKTITFSSEASHMGENLNEVAQSLSSMATQMQATSEGMHGVATDTSIQSSKVSDSANEASASVGSVAAATEEFSASIAGISEQVDRASEMGRDAVMRVENADAVIQSLLGATDKIGAIVGLISEIAEQTNMLALNATIEAARAGTAGKGFAVVASEVKDLANQTGKATEQIVSQVSNMQKATREAVSAIESVEEAINQIDETGATIASTVDEQRVVVNEISSSVQLAVQQVGVVADAISSVSGGAETTAASVEQIQSVAKELGQRADGMRANVESFVEKVTTV